MDAALIQRVNSKLTDLAELQSREAATTLQRGWRQKRRAAAARRPPPAPSVSSLAGSLFGGRRDAPAPPAPKPETRQQEQWEKEGTALTPFALALPLLRRVVIWTLASPLLAHSQLVKRSRKMGSKCGPSSDKMSVPLLWKSTFKRPGAIEARFVFLR